MGERSAAFLLTGLVAAVNCQAVVACLTFNHDLCAFPKSRSTPERCTDPDPEHTLLT
jgi:hypothetical protein